MHIDAPPGRASTSAKVAFLRTFVALAALVCIAAFTLLIRNGPAAREADGQQARRPINAAYVCGAAAGSGSECAIVDTTTGQRLAKLPWVSNVIATDAGGDVYVSPQSGLVDVYAPGGTALVATLQNPGDQTVGIAWSPKLLAVANAMPIAPGTGDVSVYESGATTPSYYLRDGLLETTSVVSGVAFDALGNCYLAYFGGRDGGGIDAFADCSETAAPLRVHVTFPKSHQRGVLGLAFDADDNLVYSAGDYGQVFLCRRLQSCKADERFGGFAVGIAFDAGFKNGYFIEPADGSAPPHAAKWIVASRKVVVYAKPPGAGAWAIAPSEGVGY